MQEFEHKGEKKTMDKRLGKIDEKWLFIINAFR